jgi:hypothetical protein
MDPLVLGLAVFSAASFLAFVIMWTRPPGTNLIVYLGLGEGRDATP